MRVGARVEEINPVDFLDEKNIPLFFSKLYDENTKQGRVPAHQADLLWKYLNSLPGPKIQRSNLNAVLESVLISLREAAAEAAHVLGQIINHNSNKVVHEMLFYLISYYNEIALIGPKNMIEFVRKCGIDMAKYIEVLLGYKNIDMDRLETKLEKDPRVILSWLAGMLRSNYLIVHEVFGALLGTTMQNLAYKIHGLNGTFMSEIKETNTSLTKLKDVANNLSKTEGVPKENQKRLQEALKQVGFLESAKEVGTIEPWTLASILTQIYHEETIDKNVAKLLVEARLGKPMNEFLIEFDHTISLLKTEIWLSIIAFARGGSLGKSTLQSYISNYVEIAGGWSLFGGNDDDDDDDDEKKKRDAEKGKEERTEEDVAYEKRREERLAKKAKEEHLKHMVEMKKKHQNALEEAMRADPDNPYNPEINSEARFQEARSRVRGRLQELQNRAAEKMISLGAIERVVENSNLQTRITAGQAAISAFKGTLQQKNMIQDALGVIDGLQTENLQVIQEQLAPLQFEIDILVEILRTLDRQEQSLHGRIYKTSTKIGVFLMIVAGIFCLLYFIDKTNKDWISAVNVSLEDMKKRTAATYTRGLANMWETLWTERYLAERAQGILGNYTPLRWLKSYDMSADILENTAAEGMRRLATFVTELPTMLTSGTTSMLNVISQYTAFTRPYVNGLNSLLTDTVLHINELIKKGHTIENSVDLRNVIALRDMITRALENYKGVVNFPVTKVDITYDALVEKIAGANQAFLEAIMAAHTKMMEGQLPQAANTYGGGVFGFFNDPKGWALSVAGGFTMVLEKFKRFRASQTPQPSDLHPYRMLDIISAGRSPEFLKVYKDVGKATVAIGIASVAVPMLMFFHVSNLMATFYHAGGDPTIVTTRFFFDSLGSIMTILGAVFNLIEIASTGVYNMNWAFYGMCVGALVFLFPSMAIWAKIKEMIDRKRQTNAIQQTEVHPPPGLPANPETSTRPASTPALTVQPSAVNPTIFETPTPRIEAPTLDPRLLQAAADDWLEKLKKAQKEKEEKVTVLPEDDFSLESFVRCVICDNEARFVCSHCHERAYCNEECGKHDWSIKNNNHTSF